MNIAGLRSIGVAILLVLLAGASCNRPKQASSESSAAPTPHGIRAPITAHAPDAFYDPPSDLSHQPGALLRSEPLKDVILPAGMRGWRILYATTVDDSTPATAVATVFAPTDPTAGSRPVIAWEHATTGLLQKCMPSLMSAPAAGIPGRDRIVLAGWVVGAADYSVAEKGGPHPYLIGEGEARAALDSARAARQMSQLTLDKRMVVWGHSQGGTQRFGPALSGHATRRISKSSASRQSHRPRTLRTFSQWTSRWTSGLERITRCRTDGSTLTSHSSKRFGPRRSMLRVR